MSNLNMNKEEMIAVGIYAGVFAAGVAATKLFGFAANKYKARKAAKKAEAVVKETVEEVAANNATATA